MATSDAKIPVSIRLWAQMRVDAGTSRIEIEVPADASVADALEVLYRDHPGIARHRATARAALNNEYVGEDRLLTRGITLTSILSVPGMT